MTPKGFTLIEAITVISIISILSMFAYPMYQDHTKRTYVAEGIELADGIKPAMTSYFSTKGSWPNAQELNIKNITSNSVSGIWAGSEYKTFGLISIYFNESVVENADPFPLAPAPYYPARANNYLLLSTLNATPEGITIHPKVIKWECLDHGSGIKKKWLPPACRESLKYFFPHTNEI